MRLCGKRRPLAAGAPTCAARSSATWIASRSAAATEVDGARFALWDLYVAKPIARGFECYGAVDNFTNSQDPNTGVLGASGAPAAIYRPEIGRTVRFGVRWGLGR